MAYSSTPPNAALPQASRSTAFGRMWSRAATTVMASLEAQSRQDQIGQLAAKSDEDLAKMGLSRDRIVHHVFRDIIHL